MLFPAGTDRGFRRTPLVTTAIITITVAMFFIQMFAANKAAQESADSQPVLISAGDSTFVAHLVAGPGQPWYTHVTSAFLHADWLHIAGNMIFLAIFGVLIEDRLGHLGMAVLYLSGAVASSLLFDVLQGGFGLGASGAVATITGAFLALMPLVQVRVVTFVGGVLNVTGWVFVLLAVAFDLMLAFRLADLNIGWGAHLGGYAFGFSVAMILLVTRVLAPERHDLFALLKRAKLRRELRQAAALQGARARVDSPRPSDPALADIALRRAAIAERLSAPDFPAAADLYAGMIEAHPSAPAASVLSRRHQLDLANHLHTTGRSRLAALAYERFAEVYRDERDAPRARLLVALIAARTLDDPARARAALAGLSLAALAPDERALAETLAAELPKA